MDEFDYDLPAELIAQEPARRRDGSRLMVVSRDDSRGADPCLHSGLGSGPDSASDPGAGPASGSPFEHRGFGDLPDLLRSGDLLVMNDTRVLAARVMAHRSTGGRVEVLFVAPETGTPDVWRALVRPARRVRAGQELTAAGARLRVVDALADGMRRIRFDGGVDVAGWLEAHGAMPLPPYIHPDDSAARRDLDRDRYQTVYARQPGAVAAPTAGLHFTADLLDRLAGRGIETCFVTLEVGLGTFRPVTADRAQDHVMEAESYRVSETTARAVNAARRAARRVVAVGTTSVRTLEHAADLGGGAIAAGEGRAGIFIVPGYRFRVVDAMITNLHLPRSTPILMASAMVGRERLLAAYREAIRHRYRFYSYGDAMLLQ